VLLRLAIGVLFPGVSGEADTALPVGSPRPVKLHRGQGNLGRVDGEDLWDFAALMRFVSEPVAASIVHADYLATGKDARNALKKRDPFVLFGDCKDGTRDDAHLLTRSVATLDIDTDAGGLYGRLARQEAPCAPFAYAWHTTRSHTEESPRVRILVPLSGDVTPDEYRRLVPVLAAMFGAAIDPASVKPSQMMFCPVHNIGAPYKYGAHAGEGYANPDALLRIDSQAPAKAKTHVQEADGDEDVFADAPVPDDTIDDLRSALAYLADKGWADAGARDKWVRIGQFLKSLDEPGCDLFIEFSNFGDAPDSDDELRERFAGFGGDRSGYKAIFKAAQEEGWENPRRRDYSTLEDRTDTGNANLLARLTAGDLRFVTEKRLWLWWDREKWTPDESGSIAQSQALRVSEHYQKEAAGLMRQSRSAALTPADSERLKKAAESIAKWAAQCRNLKTLKNMLEVASKFPGVQLPLKALDTDPMLFGVANGVVDLTTGELRPAAREDFVTKRSPLRYVKGKPAPAWIKFVNEITARPIAAEVDPATGEVLAGTVGRFKPRSDLARYLHKALGYSLTGTTEQQKMFVCVGGGSNGKNVLLDTVKWVLGDYGVSIPPAVLLESHKGNDPERASPVAARLAGARAAISSESKPGQKFDVATIKSHTGDGYMTARFLNQNAFEFQTSHKLWLMTNSAPAIDHLDGAIRGRLHFIPFDRKWNRPGESGRDPALPEGDALLTSTLQGEGEGILAWLVAGAVEYDREKLVPPAEVVRMTRDYFNEQDVLAKWLDQCERCDPKQGGTAKELFEVFESWCADEGFDSAYTQKAFCQEMQARGVTKAKRETGMHYGLRALGGF